MPLTLILCIAAALVAPTIARRLRDSHFGTGIDNCVLIIVLGLIIFSLVPEAIEHIGFWAIAVLGLSFFVPWVIERFFHRHETSTHKILLLVAGVALMIHAVGDGFALKLAGNNSEGLGIKAGLIVHRFGAALALWWLMRPIIGRALAYTILSGLALSTAAGFMLAGNIETIAGTNIAGIWQALAAGSLLHILGHPLAKAHRPEAKTIFHHRLANQIGTAAGLLFIVLLFTSHINTHQTTADTTPVLESTHHGIDAFFEIGVLLSPLLLLGLIIGPLWTQWQKNPPLGQSTGGQSTGGQSTGGQSTGGQSTRGQSTRGQSTRGQSTRDQSTRDQSTRDQSTTQNSWKSLFASAERTAAITVCMWLIAAILHGLIGFILPGMAFWTHVTFTVWCVLTAMIIIRRGARSIVISSGAVTHHHHPAHTNA